MICDLAEIELQKLYDVLPVGSNGRLADNPRRFLQFREGIGIALDTITFALVCLDEQAGTYTWHLHCGNYGLDNTFDFWSLQEDQIKAAVGNDISIIRRRNLEIVEVYHRYEGHMFF